MSKDGSATFDLEVRYGVRTIRNIEFGVLAFSLPCICGHLLATVFLLMPLAAKLAGLISPGSNELYWLQFVSSALTLISILFNRPTMFLALRMLVAIEAAIAESRAHQPRGWAGFFTELFPFSILIPPGDLLATTLLILLIRTNSDHLNPRQSVVFLLAQIWLILGNAMQYSGAALLLTGVGAMWSSTSLTLLALLVVGNLITAVGVGTVAWSLRAIRCELKDLVRLTHWDQDPTSVYLADLSSSATPSITQ